MLLVSKMAPSVDKSTCQCVMLSFNCQIVLIQITWEESEGLCGPGWPVSMSMGDYLDYINYSKKTFPLFIASFLRQGVLK